MSLAYIGTWIIVFALIFFPFIMLWNYLQPRNRSPKVLIGLIATSILAIAAFVGMIIIQVHAINLFKTYLSLLFGAAFFVTMIIPYWTLPFWLQQQHQSRGWHIFRNAGTAFAVVYALFALVLVIFKP